MKRYVMQMIPYNTVQYDMIQRKMKWGHTIQSDVMQ